MQHNQNNELLDDIDQSSVEEDEQAESEHKAGYKTKIVYPEPPTDFDKARYADEFERYDPANVAELMYNRKERKIPGSVLKPHSPYCNLV